MAATILQRHRNGTAKRPPCGKNTINLTPGSLPKLRRQVTYRARREERSWRPVMPRRWPPSERNRRGSLWIPATDHEVADIAASQVGPGGGIRSAQARSNRHDETAPKCHPKVVAGRPAAPLPPAWLGSALAWALPFAFPLTFSFTFPFAFPFALDLSCIRFEHFSPPALVGTI